MGQPTRYSTERVACQWWDQGRPRYVDAATRTFEDQLTKMVTVGKGEIIYLPGDPVHTVYLLKKGRIKTIMTGQRGKEFTAEVLQLGERFGDMDLSEQSVRTMRAEAREDAVLCVLPREDFEQYLNRHPDLIVSLYEMIRRRFRKFQSHVKDLAHREMQARLAHL